MSEPVPIDGIEFVKQEIVDSWSAADILRMDPNAPISYIFEVDLEIPQEIHDHTSDYPLCPGKIEITKDMISPKSWLVYTLILQELATYPKSNIDVSILIYYRIINLFSNLLYYNGVIIL